MTFADGPETPLAAGDVIEGVVRTQHDEPGRPPRELPAGEPRLVSQRDATPQNTVFRDGAAWGLIDFDLTDTTTRATDLANTAMHWAPLCDPADREAGAQ